MGCRYLIFWATIYEKSLTECSVRDFCGEDEIRTRGTELPVRRFSKPVVSATHPPLQFHAAEIPVGTANIRRKSSFATFSSFALFVVLSGRTVFSPFPPRRPHVVAKNTVTCGKCPHVMARNTVTCGYDPGRGEA